MFKLPKLEFAGVNRANLREKKPDVFTFSILRLVLKRESQKSWPNCPESYTNDGTVSPTQKDIEMFIVLIRKTCSGLYENILNFYKGLSSMNEWSLLFFDELVIFFHFKVGRVDRGTEFPRAAVAAGNLTGVSKQQALLSCYSEKRRNQPQQGTSRLLIMGFLL